MSSIVASRSTHPLSYLSSRTINILPSCKWRYKKDVSKRWFTPRDQKVRYSSYGDSVSLCQGFALWTLTAKYWEATTRDQFTKAKGDIWPTVTVWWSFFTIYTSVPAKNSIIMPTLTFPSTPNLMLNAQFDVNSCLSFVIHCLCVDCWVLIVVVVLFLKVGVWCHNYLIPSES